MSAVTVITSRESLTKHQTFTFFMKSSDKLPSIPTDFITKNT
jgi:hypothetical protein